MRFLRVFLFIVLCSVTYAQAAYAGLGVSVTLVSGQPGTIDPGEVTQLQIELSNNSTTAPITAVAFSNTLPGTLPNGLKIAGAPTYTCTDPSGPTTSAGLGTLTAALGTQSISLSGAVIPQQSASVNGTCLIILPVTAGTSNGAAAGYTYTIASGAVTGDDGAPVANIGAVNQSINVSAASLPTISKTFGSSTLTLGGASTTLTITISNPNGFDLTNFSVTDNFPELGGSSIIKVANPVVSNAVCSGAGVAPTFAPVADAVSITATGGTVAAGGTCTLTVAVDARQTASVYQTAFATNTINGASDFSSDIGIIPANATAQVRVMSPLSLTKAFAHGSIASGQSDTFTIVFTNSGTNPLTINSFTDSPIDGVGNLTYGLKVNGVPSMVCSGTGTAGTFARTASDFGVVQTADTTIAAGGTCTLTVNFTATAQTPNVPITFTNTIAEGAVGTTSAGVVSRSASAAILVSDELRVLKSVTPTNPAPGNPVRYTVSVQNWSTTPISNITAADTLTNGQTFLTGTIGGINYTPTLSGTGCSGLTVPTALGASSVSMTIGTLPARTNAFSPGNCDITFYTMTSTTATDGANVANVLGAGTVCYGAGPTCNGRASQTTSSTVDADTLTVTKAFSPAGPLAENTITRMTVSFSNLSANPITSVSLSDTLPVAVSGGGQLRVASPANAASTCGSPTITAVAGSTSVAMNGATIPARASSGLGAAGTCVLQVDVVGPAGSYNNVVTVDGIQTYGNGTTNNIGPITSNTANIVYTSSLSATKSFTPSSVSSGGKSRVLIRLANGSALPLSGISVTDPLPTGMVLANPVNAYSTCAGTHTFTGAAGASSLAFSGAELAASGTCDVLFDVVATGSANWVNTIPVGNISASGGVTNQVAVSGTLTFNAPIGLSVVKATNPSTLAFPGQSSQLTITITNGTTPVTNLSMTDYFTADGTSGAASNGMQIAATPSAGTTCSGGVVSAVAGDDQISISGVSLAASASCTVTVNVTSVVTGGITNYIPPSSITTDQGLSNASQATTSLTTQENLGVTKKFTPNVMAAGERSRLRITFYNPANQPAANVSVTDNLPAGVTIPAGANPYTNCAGGVISTPTTSRVVVSGANIPAASGGTAQTCYAEIDVTASAAGDYTNTIAIGALTGSIGGIPASNSQPATDVLHVKLPLVIHKAIAALTLDTGNPAGFTTGEASRSVGVTAPLVISINNPNTSSVTQLSVSDSLPTGLYVAQTPSAATTCTSGTVSAPASGSTISLTGATLGAGATCTVTVSVVSNVTGSYTNTIPASAVSTFEGVTNEEPTQARVIIASPPSVTKEFSPAVIPASGTSRLTIYLTNDNDSAMTLTSVFTDNLPTAPGAVLVAGTPNVTKTCPGSVTATAGAATVSYANGAQIPAGGCTISVNVTAATAGVHTNNIPAGALVTDFGSNPSPANATLTVSPLGYISGKVFRDNTVTPNGTFQSGTDTALSGIAIELRSGATCAGTLLETATTDAAGNYLFSALAGGTYSVCQTAQPTSTTNSITTAGTIVSTNGSTGTAGTASNPTTTTSQIVGIVLNANGGSGETSGSINNNFSEIVPSSISGRVFMDQNNNGTQNGADTGISGVTVELLNGSGTVVDTQVTDASGDYTFSNLTPGTYSVREPTQPSNSNNGITTAGSVDNGGTAGTATAVGVVPSVIASIILPPNTASINNNFAEIPYGRSINGTVFFDYNNNAVLNGDDYGLSNVSLSLSGTDVNGAAVSATTTTAANGTYSFTGLPAGTYSVVQAAQPSGTTNGTTTVGTTGGAASNPTATSSQIINIDLTGSNTLSAGNDFPEVPNSAPDLTIAKTHSPDSFAAGSSSGTFTITPRNIGGAATSGIITISDTLPSGLTLASIPAGTGWTCSGSVGASSFSCTSTSVIASGASGNAVSFRVLVGSGLSGQLLTNVATISGGGELAGFDGNNQDSDTVAISSTARISGTVWRDTDHDRILDAGEPRVEGWKVELLLGGVVVDTVLTAANGTYTFTNISPGSGYEVRFREPTTDLVFGNAVTNERGITPTNGTRDSGVSTANSGTNAGNPGGADLSTASGTLRGITILAGDNIIEQSLPLDPAGVVYNSVTRQPVAGAQVTISGPGGFDPAVHLVGGQATVTTGADGFYQFLLTPTAPSGVYTLAITTYPGAYVPLPSTIIPVCSGTLVTDAAPDPALVHVSSEAPTLSAPLHTAGACPANTGALAAGNQATTQHYFSFNINPATSGDIVNNHIPLDPIGAGDIVVTKTSPIVNTSVGQLVPYTITVRNTSSNNYTNLTLRDMLPAGFKYKKGSASIDGIAAEPVASGRVLSWAGQDYNAGTTKKIKLILLVGTGVQPGEYVNTAQVFDNTGSFAVSNLASATVRIVPDPVFDCSDIIGKVFDDKNTNGYQDEGEQGIPNVRVATLNGLLVTTDADGRFHVACGAVPDADRGSNFLMKLDERTLPTGYRVTTENPRVVRVTRGKMTKLNFGAAIHRVVRIDMQDDAFESGSEELKQGWQEQIELLPEQLKSASSVVRLAYVVSGEDQELARKRLKHVSNLIRDLWEEKECCHEIMIEEELVLPSGTKGGK